MNNKKKEIVLSIKDSGIYFNPNEKVDWNNTNFPEKEFFSISQSKNIFWLVEMKSYNKSNGELEVTVNNYKQDKPQNFDLQKSKAQLNSIRFRNLSWEKIKEALNYYQLEKFIRIENGLLTKEKEIDAPLEGAYTFEISQPITKIAFKMGYIETSKRIKGISNNLQIKIYNSQIIPEFEYIKFYFSKIFGSRRIRIKGTIGNKNDRSTYKFRSPEIERINEQLINGIKRLEIERKIKKPKVIAIDKSLFTPEEYFDGFEGDIGNNIRKSDQDILKDILELKGIRNRKQLEYISGHLQSSQERIQFTLTPQFGFLFYVEGEEMHHYIWELLNSHATYLWSKDKEYPRTDFLNTVKRKINYIRDQGRMKYLSHEVNEELVFSKINHKSAGSDIIDGFPRWRKRVNEKLI